MTNVAGAKNMAAIQSTGTAVALGGSAGSSLTIVLMWACKVWGVDLPPEVAVAIVSLATAVTGAIMHYREPKAPPVAPQHPPRSTDPILDAELAPKPAP